MTDTDPSSSTGSWIGKTTTATDTLGVERSQALWATLGADDPQPQAGAALPPLWHWLYFWDIAPRSELGGEGHRTLGGFLPALETASGTVRRMWAGSRVTFHSSLRLGEEVRRVSTITAVERKTGRSGDLTFLTLRHQVEGPAGLAITDEHDIVYRHPPPNGASEPAPRAPEPAPTTSDRSENWTADPVLLFRVSALTFNGHRIHYDEPYATGAENYPGVVVHGPLLAILMAGAASRHRGGAPLATFGFRGTTPVFADQPFTVHVAEDAGEARAWVRDHQGAYAAKGRFSWS